MPELSYVCIDSIKVLITKVMEVVNNNDWSTEDGQNRADTEPCLIEVICKSIAVEINGKT